MTSMRFCFGCPNAVLVGQQLLLQQRLSAPLYKDKDTNTKTNKKTNTKTDKETNTNTKRDTKRRVEG